MIYLAFLSLLLGCAHGLKLSVTKGREECVASKYTKDNPSPEVEIDYHFFVEGRKGEVSKKKDKKKDKKKVGTPRRRLKHLPFV
jgi:hypothetical protein